MFSRGFLSRLYRGSLPLNRVVRKPMTVMRKSIFSATAGSGAALMAAALYEGDPNNIDVSTRFKNTVLVDSRAVRALFHVIRNKNTSNPDYVAYADRLMTILAEEGLAHLNQVRPATIPTPCGHYEGLELPPNDQLCVVSIVRSGDILMEAVRKLAPGINVGKILIQRNEEDPEKKSKLFYHKLPADIGKRQVILVDPMLATGGSVRLAIQVLVANGVMEENIVFLNVVSCPEGLRAMERAHPKVKVVTCAVDPYLNENKYIVPGLGDFGDRYYGTQ